MLPERAALRRVSHAWPVATYALGLDAALHDLGLDVAGLHHGLDHGRRVDDGGRIRELCLAFLLVLLDEHRLFPPAHEDADAARDAAADDDEDDEDDRKRLRRRGLVVLVLARDEHVVAG